MKAQEDILFSFSLAEHPRIVTVIWIATLLCEVLLMIVLGWLCISVKWPPLIKLFDSELAIYVGFTLFLIVMSMSMCMPLILCWHLPHIKRLKICITESRLGITPEGKATAWFDFAQGQVSLCGNVLSTADGNEYVLPEKCLGYRRLSVILKAKYNYALINGRHRPSNYMFRDN